jgi:hypothetical protein
MSNTHARTPPPHTPHTPWTPSPHEKVAIERLFKFVEGFWEQHASKFRQAWNKEFDKSQDFDDWVGDNFWWPLINASQRYDFKYATSAETIQVLYGIYENACITVLPYISMREE